MEWIKILSLNCND